MKYLVDSIIQYLDLPQTNYALQIDGSWGTGKTYYFKNTVISKIEEHEITTHNMRQVKTKKKKEVEKEKWRVCYVSLNGISTLNEISENIFLQISGNTSQIAFQGMKFLSRYGGNISSVIPVSNKLAESIGEGIASKIQSGKIDNMNGIVLCFDDLERIDEKLSLKQIFGFINSNFIEHNNVKVIFISHEEEIKDGEYLKIKEKIIGRKLKFIQSENNFLEQIVENVFSDKLNFIDFYKKEKSDLGLVINFFTKNINLRTLRFMLDIFSILQNEALKLCKEEEHLELSKTLFLNTFVIAEEYKNGDLTEMNQLKNIYDSLYMFPFNKEESYEKKLLAKYHKKIAYFDKNIYYFKFVSKYILDGILDNSYKEEIENYLTLKVRKNDIKKEEPLRLLNNFIVSEDEEIKEAQKKVLEKISQEGYLIGDYLNIHNIFEILENKNLIFIDDDYKNIIETGFENTLNNWIPKDEFDFYNFNPEINKEDVVISNMVNKINDKITHVTNKEKKNRVQNWLNGLSTDSIEPNLYRNIEYENNLFQIFIDINLHKNIKFHSNKSLTYLRSFLDNKYLKVSNAKDFVNDTELNCIDEFLESLTKVLSTEEIQGLKKINIELLKKLLVEIKNHLTD